jgi:hypothetical protein
MVLCATVIEEALSEIRKTHPHPGTRTSLDQAKLTESLIEPSDLVVVHVV